MGDEDGNAPPTDDHMDEAPPKKRKTRGPCTNKKRNKKNKGEILKVQWSQYGQHIGANATDLTTQIGCFARQTVPIQDTDWRNVDEAYKEKIWGDLTQKFDVDARSKDRLMKRAGKAWRSFKTRLTTKFILPYKDDPDKLRHPPPLYQKIIKQEDWERFVESRLRDEFGEFSEQQRERRYENKYDHCTGRSGYAKIEEEMRAEFGQWDSPIDRCDLWKRGRKRKDGEYHPNVVPVIEKIEELKGQPQSSVTDITSGSDILTQALGKPEHRGRVRGVGRFVTPTSYFKRVHGNYERDKKVEELERQLKESHDEIARLRSEVVTVKSAGSSNTQKVENETDIKAVHDWKKTPTSGVSMKDEMQLSRKCGTSKVGKQLHLEDLSNSDSEGPAKPESASANREGKCCDLKVEEGGITVGTGTILKDSTPNVIVSLDQAYDQNTLLPIQ